MKYTVEWAGGDWAVVLSRLPAESPPTHVLEGKTGQARRNTLTTPVVLVLLIVLGMFLVTLIHVAAGTDIAGLDLPDGVADQLVLLR